MSPFLLRGFFRTYILNSDKDRSPSGGFVLYFLLHSLRSHFVACLPVAETPVNTFLNYCIASSSPQTGRVRHGLSTRDVICQFLQLSCPIFKYCMCFGEAQFFTLLCRCSELLTHSCKMPFSQKQQGLFFLLILSL